MRCRGESTWRKPSEPGAPEPHRRDPQPPRRIGGGIVMILAALRDLQWRRKRFVIAIVATALVFSMTLVLSGVSESFPREVNSLVSAIGGESYLAAAGEAGPFTSTAIVAVDKA